MSEALLDFIRNLYGNDRTVPLHEPRFGEEEQRAVQECLASTFVSTVGPFTPRFEKLLAEYLGCDDTVAVVNGTSALHASLKLLGAEADDLVLTQSLSFVATANAISHCGSEPVFLDVDPQTLSLCPDAVSRFLEHHCVKAEFGVLHVDTGKKVKGIVLMHTFGHPGRSHELRKIADDYGLFFLEDAAEALGSRHSSGEPVGLHGHASVFSFNGNKIITTGGGGCVVSKEPGFLKEFRHFATTAKLNVPGKFVHDRVAYNFRLPNLNAALGCAQMTHLETFLEKKRRVASTYQNFFLVQGGKFIEEPRGSRSNYWLNAVLLETTDERERLLDFLLENKVEARAVWDPLHTLPMYRHCIHDELVNTEFLGGRLLNLPSSVPSGTF